MKLQANNINIEYSLTGKVGAPTVVLSHSLACNHFMWNPQLEILEKDYQVLAYDTRGHGNSEVTPRAYYIFAGIGFGNIQTRYFVGFSRRVS